MGGLPPIPQIECICIYCIDTVEPPIPQIECMCLTADIVEQMQPDSRYSGSMLLREALYI